jgi:carboxyl-terminal processing protease
VADSLKSEFKTRSGRKVLDGGGLDPDILTQPEEYSSIVRQLANDGLLFEYATTYCAAKPVPSSAKGFRLTDEEYRSFVAWVKAARVNYTSDTERQADQLIASAKDEKYFSELQGPLSDLKNKIAAGRESGLTRYKTEITRLLEEEISYHFLLTQGQIDVSLDRDAALQEARKVLADQDRYKKILMPN